MIDDTTQAPPPKPYDPAAGDLHPALGQFNPPPEYQAWAADAIGQIQDHITAHTIAQQNIEAGNQFVKDIAATKQNLVDMVKSDPTAVPLAFNLVDGFPDHMADMAGHFKEQIARSAITGLADVNRDAAHKAIDDYAEHLTVGDASALRQYADNMELLRRHDNLSSALEISRQQDLRSNANSGQWLSRLADPTTGQLSFPQGWGQGMMQDNTLAPQAKASLFTAYRNLQTNGDPETSDPRLAAELMRRTSAGYQSPDHPTPAEVIGHVGSRLTLADAQFISGLTGPQSPQTKSYVTAMSQAMDTARTQIGNPQAFARFVNWFLPVARSGAVLDPGSKDYLLTPERMAQFQPTGDDVIAPIQAAVDRKQRPSLGQIFAGNAPPPPTLPQKPWSEEPYDKGDDRYTEKGGPVKIPGGGQRPF